MFSENQSQRRIYFSTQTFLPIAACSCMERWMLVHREDIINLTHTDQHNFIASSYQSCHWVPHSMHSHNRDWSTSEGWDECSSAHKTLHLTGSLHCISHRRHSGDSACYRVRSAYPSSYTSYARDRGHRTASAELENKRMLTAIRRVKCSTKKTELTNQGIIVPYMWHSISFRYPYALHTVRRQC